ncbi:aspartate/glutamate racemase family protein [Bradyrhizobium sp. USDA 4529]
MLDKVLGILELENEPVKHAGFLAGPGTFQFRVRRKKVLGATARKVIDGDRTVKDEYIKCARQLEDEGVAAIIANCGFAGMFQGEVSAVVSVPVALSSLLLVPFVAKTLPPGRKVGILTYDGSKLNEDHFEAAGWSSADIGVCVAGIEGSDSWRQLAKPVPDIVPIELIKDIRTTVRALLTTEPGIAALVFECTGFPIASEEIRQETGLRVVDVLGLAKLLIEASPPQQQPLLLRV